MSTLKVDNFQPSAGGTSFGIGGVAKAWARYQTAATFVLDESFNVSSLTDNGAGDATVNFTNDMATATHAPTMACSETTANLSAQAAGSSRLNSKNNSHANADCSINGFSTHGDLA